MLKWHLSAKRDVLSNFPLSANYFVIESEKSETPNGVRVVEGVKIDNKKNENR